MQQLEELAPAFPSRYEHLMTDTDVGISHGLNAEQFVKWASQVRTLGALHCRMC